MKRKVTSIETITSEDKVGKFLHELQPSATDTETLVGANRMIKSKEVKTKKNVSTEKKTEASEDQIKVTSKDKSVEIKSEIKREIEAENLTRTNLSGLGENWQITTVERLMALKEKYEKELIEHKRRKKEEDDIYDKKERLCNNLLHNTTGTIEALQKLEMTNDLSGPGENWQITTVERLMALKEKYEKELIECKRRKKEEDDIYDKKECLCNKLLYHTTETIEVLQELEMTNDLSGPGENWQITTLEMLMALKEKCEKELIECKRRIFGESSINFNKDLLCDDLLRNTTGTIEALQKLEMTNDLSGPDENWQITTVKMLMALKEKYEKELIECKRRMIEERTINCNKIVLCFALLYHTTRTIEVLQELEMTNGINNSLEDCDL